MQFCYSHLCSALPLILNVGFRGTIPIENLRKIAAEYGHLINRKMAFDSLAGGHLLGAY